ncbi:MAG: fluoride efflux transporter CrcB [Ekhidna sp.]|nr:fluoride efflux transporter CrcB [Ekhidna sp.]
MKEFIIVGIGGMIGSMGRYGVSLIFLKSLAERSYYSTLTVNLIGSLLIGIIAGYASKINNPASLFLTVGICGGFTTFSAFSLHSINLLQNGLYRDFLLYSFLTFFCGLILCAIGYFAGCRV